MKKIVELLLFLGSLTVLFSCGSNANPADIAGLWEGYLPAADFNIRLVYRIAVADDSTLSVIHDSPDYGIKDIPVSKATLENNRVFISVALYDAVFEGTFKENIIAGRYGSGGYWTPLTLKRVSENPQFILDYMVPRLTASGEKMVEYRYASPPNRNDGWEIADAAQVGVDTSKINALMRAILREEFRNVHSVLVAKEGKIIVEEYFHGFHHDQPHPIHSISKCIVAAAVGIATEQNLIKDVNTPLYQFFPEYRELLCNGEKGAITLEHALTMTAGFEWDEGTYSYYDQRNSLVAMKSSRDWLHYLFDRPLAYHPGERHVYNTGLIIALEEVIRKVANQPSHVFAKNNLFAPLGISKYRYDNIAGFHMLPRDMAKIGWLFLNGGQYRGSQIISKAWVDKAMLRFERCQPRYWNHWWPIVYFVEGRAIASYVAAGFGGQTITIFPALNTVIVMTGGSFLEYTDFDVLIRNYLLPAILTPEFVAKSPAIESPHIKKVDNLHWGRKYDDELGCIRGAIDHLGLNISDAWLYGATGAGFLLNIDETVHPKSIVVWSKQRFYELCRNLGFQIEAIWSNQSAPDFHEKQKLIWDKVREAVDAGYPCYGFHLDSPIRYLIFGYDSCGYYYKGAANAEEGKGPLVWDALGHNNLGLLGMHFVKPVSAKISDQQAIKEAFQFVLEFSENSKQWVYDGYSAGPKGYERWISILENGKADPFGAAYNAAAWAEARGFAVQFLKEAKLRLNPRMRQLFDAAMQHYETAFQQLTKVSEMIPLTASSQQREAYLKDQARCQAIIGHLNSAKNAEIEGLKVLAEIVRAL